MTSSGMRRRRKNLTSLGIGLIKEDLIHGIRRIGPTPGPQDLASRGALILISGISLKISLAAEWGEGRDVAREGGVRSLPLKRRKNMEQLQGGMFILLLRLALKRR